MKIVHIITRFIRGGADENTLYSCNGQAALGHDVYLLYGRENHVDILNRLHPDVKPICVQSLVRQISPLNDFRALLDIHFHLSRISPDIVHTHTSKAGFVGRVAAKTSRSPIIIHGVHILPFLNVKPLQKLAYLACEKILSPLTDAFVDVSAGMKKECLAKQIGKDNNHFVIPSGMDVNLFRNAKPITLTELKNAAPEPVMGWANARLILMVAAFEERKRQLEFLEVFVRIVRANPEACLVLAGSGPLESAIATKIETLGLTGHVRIIGFRSDIARWIKTAQFCILSSEREGLPRVVVQYALGGKPIIATDLPGIDFIVQNNVTGYRVKSVAEMEAPIHHLLNDSGASMQLETGISNVDLSPWSISHMNEKLEELYVSLWSRKIGIRRMDFRNPATALK
ncbi:glycosyltransferase [Sphingobium sp. Sx8-8]|uniref:glycosyltransferase n=1 Tax=Sphingobium sp. Sx8-8 TaxID=2933617 RepID=UPI001F5A46E1|nr:glycosyltransferase [Sphingobium sp. Sx8-8]